MLGMDKSYDGMFSHVFTPILDRYGVPQQDRRYIMAFYIQGLMAIIMEWLRSGCINHCSQTAVLSTVRTVAGMGRDWRGNRHEYGPCFPGSHIYLEAEITEMDTVSVDLVEELSPLMSKIENSWRCIPTPKS